MRKIDVRRKGYEVEGHYSHSKTGKREYVHEHHVHPTMFSRVENLPATRHLVTPKLKEGTLGGKGFFESPKGHQHGKLREDVKKYGYKHVLGKVDVISVLDKRTNPKVAHEAAEDRKWLVKQFGGPSHGYDLHKRRSR
jgi:hypothetical protein